MLPHDEPESHEEEDVLHDESLSHDDEEEEESPELAQESPQMLPDVDESVTVPSSFHPKLRLSPVSGSVNVIPPWAQTAANKVARSVLSYILFN